MASDWFVDCHDLCCNATAAMVNCSDSISILTLRGGRLANVFSSVVVAPMGSGKSTFAKVCESMGTLTKVYDLDEILHIRDEEQGNPTMSYIRRRIDDQDWTTANSMIQTRALNNMALAGIGRFIGGVLLLHSYDEALQFGFKPIDIHFVKFNNLQCMGRVVDREKRKGTKNLDRSTKLCYTNTMCVALEIQKYNQDKQLRHWYDPIFAISLGLVVIHQPTMNNPPGLGLLIAEWEDINNHMVEAAPKARQQYIPKHPDGEEWVVERAEVPIGFDVSDFLHRNRDHFMGRLRDDYLTMMNRIMGDDAIAFVTVEDDEVPPLVDGPGSVSSSDNELD
jgi:hypothetical protein